jgi:hypothetical protein
MDIFDLLITISLWRLLILVWFLFIIINGLFVTIGITCITGVNKDSLDTGMILMFGSCIPGVQIILSIFLFAVTIRDIGVIAYEKIKK